MIKIERTHYDGFKLSVRAARNSYGSHDKSDSVYVNGDGLGGDDLRLMKDLAFSGPSHAKFRRFITVSFDMKAPLYFWKQFDTYKVGVTQSRGSTMHTITKEPFVLESFSHEWLPAKSPSEDLLLYICRELNWLRNMYLNDFKDDKEARKGIWRQIIQLLPSSYNQVGTVLLNYEVLSKIYNERRHHKLPEWKQFCNWIEALPYADGLIFRKEDE